jgi:Flp pilus assembly protein TadG
LERERGEVTTTVLVVPIAMLLILLVVQAALVFHAQAIVDAAAQDGAFAGQGESGTEAVARTVAHSVIGTTSGSLLTNVDISVEPNSSRFSVTVQANVKSLIPGYTPTISSTAVGPRETFIPLNRT